MASEPIVQRGAEVVAEYRQAWEGWQRQLEKVHGVFLDGEPLGAPQLKGLLNRETRTKERYDAARRKLLGLPELEGGATDFAAPPGPRLS